MIEYRCPTSSGKRLSKEWDAAGVIDASKLTALIARTSPSHEENVVVPPPIQAPPQAAVRSNPVVAHDVYVVLNQPTFYFLARQRHAPNALNVLFRRVATFSL